MSFPDQRALTVAHPKPTEQLSGLSKAGVGREVVEGRVCVCVGGGGGGGLGGVRKTQGQWKSESSSTLGVTLQWLGLLGLVDTFFVFSLTFFSFSFFEGARFRFSLLLLFFFLSVGPFFFLFFFLLLFRRTCIHPLQYATFIHSHSTSFSNRVTYSSFIMVQIHRE